MTGIKGSYQLESLTQILHDELMTVDHHYVFCTVFLRYIYKSLIIWESYTFFL